MKIQIFIKNFIESDRPRLACPLHTPRLVPYRAPLPVVAAARPTLVRVHKLRATDHSKQDRRATNDRHGRDETQTEKPFCKEEPEQGGSDQEDNAKEDLHRGEPCGLGAG